MARGAGQGVAQTESGFKGAPGQTASLLLRRVVTLPATARCLRPPKQQQAAPSGGKLRPGSAVTLQLRTHTRPPLQAAHPLHRVTGDSSCTCTQQPLPPWRLQHGSSHKDLEGPLVPAPFCRRGAGCEGCSAERLLPPRPRPAPCCSDNGQKNEGTAQRRRRVPQRML